MNNSVYGIFLVHLDVYQKIEFLLFVACLTLEMVAERSTETSANFYHITLCQFSK
jgi:hypothetical protein